MKSQFKCPACQQPLNVIKLDELTLPLLYCGYGKCKNWATEVGKPIATTEEAAYAELVKSGEAEEEKKAG